MTAIGEAVPIRIPFHGSGPGRGPAGFYEAVIVTLDEDGLRGLGEAPVVAGRGDSLTSLLDELRAGNPVSPAARCALETARCDLDARRRGVPLARLILRVPGMCERVHPSPDGRGESSSPSYINARNSARKSMPANQFADMSANFASADFRQSCLYQPCLCQFGLH